MSDQDDITEQDRKVRNCQATHHDWKQEYYGLRCTKCDLFLPDNSNWFAPLDDDMSIIGAEEWDDDECHPYDCTCEDCLQNHPERDILYGDGDYFDWGEDEDSEEEE